MTPLSLAAFRQSGRPHQSSRFPSPARTHHKAPHTDPSRVLCPAVKVLGALILPSINEFLSPAKDRHGFRPRHWTTSALLQLPTDIETGFNQRKPPHRTVCVCHRPDGLPLIQCLMTDMQDCRIVPSSRHHSMAILLPERENKLQLACFRGTKSSARIVGTGVPQGSKLSPSPYSTIT